MRQIVSGIVGVVLLSLVSSAWAYSSLTECDTRGTGGICQREMIGLEPGASNYVTAIFPAACFPRVINLRVSQEASMASPSPFGVWIAPSGVSFDGTEGRVSFFIKNDSQYPAFHIWFGFAWECEALVP